MVAYRYRARDNTILAAAALTGGRGCKGAKHLPGTWMIQHPTRRSRARKRSHSKLRKASMSKNGLLFRS
jgi:hypothetical protein